MPELQETNSQGVCPHPEIVSAPEHISDTGCHGAIYSDRSQGDVKLAHNTYWAKLLSRRDFGGRVMMVSAI